MRFVKIAAIFGILASVLFFLSSLNTVYFLFNPIAPTILLQFFRDKFVFALFPFIGILITVFYLGFIKISNYSNSRYVFFSSLFMEILSILFFLCSFFIFYKFVIEGASGEGIGFTMIFFIFSSFLFFSIAQIFFSLSLISISKKTRLAGSGGIFGLIIGILFTIFLISSYFNTSQINYIDPEISSSIFGSFIAILLSSLYLLESLILLKHN